MKTEYRQIVAVTGLPGLYQLVNTKNDGAIVRNLADNTIKFVAARKHQVTPLESIEIYTIADNVRLHEVFEKMKTDDADIPRLAAKKDNAANKTYFRRILPDYDADRVYTSDINKVIKWYALLKEKDLLDFDYLKAEESTAETEVSEAEAATAAEKNTGDNQQEVAPAPKKAPTKKTKKEPAAKKSSTKDTEKDTDRPAKKAPAKKKSTEKAATAPKKSAKNKAEE